MALPCSGDVDSSWGWISNIVSSAQLTVNSVTRLELIIPFITRPEPVVTRALITNSYYPVLGFTEWSPGS